MCGFIFSFSEIPAQEVLHYYTGCSMSPTNNLTTIIISLV